MGAAPAYRQQRAREDRGWFCLLAAFLLTLILPAAGFAQSAGGGICDRTPAVYAAILEKLGNIDNCADVTSSDLWGIRGSLDLSGLGLRELRQNDFEHLTSLEELYLRDNALVSLSGGLFDGLFNYLWGLKYLDLSGNHLASLTPDLFDRLGLLTVLRLNDNHLASLPAGLFDHVTNLTHIHLDENIFASLPAGLFDGLISLRHINLSGNAFQSLPADLFDGLDSLERLWLSRNLLVSLPGGLFDGLTSLETLSIDNNALTSLPSGLFNGLTSLEHLDLHQNELAHLPSEIFKGLSVALLRLDANRFQRLPRGIFKGMSSRAFLLLDFDENPKDAPRLHSFTVMLEAEADPSGVVVKARIPEGVPSPTRLTVTIDSVSQVLEVPVGGTGADTPVVPAPGGAVIRLEAGTIGGDGFPGAASGLDLRVPAQTMVWDDDPAPTRVMLSVSPEVVDEDVGSTTITVMAQLDGNPLPEETEVAVTLSVSGRSGVTLVPPESFVLSFSGATAAGKFTLTPSPDDGLFRGDGVVTVSGTHPSLPVTAATVFVRDTFRAQVSVNGGAGLILQPDSSFSAAEGASVTLTATSTNVLGAANFAWRQLPGDPVWALAPEVATDRAELHLAFPERSAPYTVRLSVTATHDPGAAALVRSATRNVTIEVDAADAAPVIEQAVAVVGGDTSGTTTARVVAGTKVVLRGRASDADPDQRLTVEWSGPGDVPLSEVNPDRPEVVTFTAPDELGRYMFTFSADDDGMRVGDPAVTSEVVVEVVSGLSSVRVLSRSGEGEEVELTAQPGPSGGERYTFDEGASLRLMAVTSGVLPATRLELSQSPGDALQVLDGTIHGSDSLEIDLPAWWGDYEITLTVTAVFKGIGRIAKTVKGTVRNRNGICDRTPAVHAAIVGELSGIDDCKDVAFSDLNAVRGTLDLSDSGLVVLQAYDFAGLSSLNSLLLRNNALASLPAGLFTGLSNLSEIDLSRNNLASLPSGLFAGNGFRNFRILNLSHNSFLSLPSGLLAGDGFRNLRTLNLSHNAFASLPAGLFDDLQDMTRLELHDNALESLPVGLFSGQRNLHTLELNNNALSSLPPGIFGGFPLFELDLSGNRFQELPEGLFKGVTRPQGLGKFDFSNNPGNMNVPYPTRVTLEAMENTRGVMVRIVEGAPNTTVLTLEVDGEEREVTIPYGGDRVLHPNVPAGTTVSLKRGRVAYPVRTSLNPDDYTRGVNPAFPARTIVLGEGIYVSVAALHASVSEGDEATFVLTASEAPQTTLTVPVLLSGDTTTGTASTRNVEIAGGATEALRTVPTREVSGGHGAVTAMVQGGAGYEVGVPSVAVVTVTDAHIGATLPQVSIATSVASVPEGSEVRFTLTVDRLPPSWTSYVTVEVSGEGAAANERGFQTIYAPTEVTAFTITARADDGEFQGNAAMTVKVRSGAHYVAGTPAIAGVTVWEDEKAPSRIRLTASPAMLDEDVRRVPVTVTARLNGGALPEATDVMVALSASGRPGLVTEPAQRFTITIPAGMETGAGRFTVTPAPDPDVYGGDGRVTVSGTHPSLPVTTATVFVRDTFEAQVSVSGGERLSLQPDRSFDGVRFTAAEDTSVQLTATSPGFFIGVTPAFTWSQALDDPVRVLTSEVATDRAAIPFVLPPRSAAYTAHLNVTARHDPDDASLARAFARNVMIAVAASDADPVIEQAIAEVEGVSSGGEVVVASGTEVVLRGLAADADPEQYLTLGWEGPPGVPLSLVDAGSPQVARFTAPETTGSYTFTFSADDDGALFDPPVTREVVARVVLGVSIRRLSPSVTEGGDARFEVRASEAPLVALTVDIDLTGGEDFGVGSSSQAVIASGETTALLSVPVEDDLQEEADGVLRAELRAGTGYAVAVPAFAEIAIRDIGELSPDMNRDSSIDSDDALILYYAYSLRATIGTGR